MPNGGAGAGNAPIIVTLPTANPVSKEAVTLRWPRLYPTPDRAQTLLR